MASTLVLVLVFIFDLIAFALAVAAEQRRTTALRPSGSRAWAIVLFISSWIFFVIAVSCLLSASVSNAVHTKYRRSLSCKVVRKGFFGAGAAFVVLTGIATELFYVSFSKANDGYATYARDTGVRMGNL
uniref:CASP-like protein n=1 Tax=Cannabis sativa TaxID=3483 RepID=A0A803QFX7_CANSA